MPLNRYQKTILKTVREDERKIYGLEFISLMTGAGYFSSLDAYRRNVPEYTEISTYFSGAVLFNPFSAKRETESGFYQRSEMVVIASRDHKTLAQTKNTKIQYQDIKFRISKIVDCEDTEEIVIYASRLE